MGNFLKKVGRVALGVATGGASELINAAGSGNVMGGEFGANWLDPLDISGTTARKFQASEADKERTWQTQMSNTAHQREIADLKAAGLNPVLSAGGNGTAVGSGAAASGTESDGAAKIATILNALSTVKNAKSSAKQVESQAKLNTEQENNLQNQIINRNIETAQHVAESQARINHLNEQAKSEAIDNQINEMLGISRQDTGQTRQAAWIYHNSKEKAEIQKAINSGKDNKTINQIKEQDKKARYEFNKKVLIKLTPTERRQYINGDQNTKWKLARIAKERGAFK